jgi:hypothetical protein
MRRTLLITGLVAAAALAVAPAAKADWTVTVGLGETIEPSRVKVMGCHPTSERPELTVTIPYDRGAFPVRMRVGDSVWDVVRWPGMMLAIWGPIELTRIEGCVGTFLARELKQ